MEVVYCTTTRSLCRPNVCVTRTATVAQFPFRTQHSTRAEKFVARSRSWNPGSPSTPIRQDTASSVASPCDLRTLVEHLAREHGIDRGRCYIVGFSLGAQMAIRLVHDAPDLLTGTALISANQPSDDSLTVAVNGSPTAILRCAASGMRSEAFADLLTDVGHGGVPPMILAVVLQRVAGLSDRESVDRFAFDAIENTPPVARRSTRPPASS